MSDKVEFDVEDIATFEGEVRELFLSLAEDRARMLERLGMTEHEWRCAGGAWVPSIDSIEMPSKWTGEEAESAAPAAPPPPPPPPPELPEGWRTWPAVWIGNGRESLHLAWLRRYGVELNRLAAIAVSQNDEVGSTSYFMGNGRVAVVSNMFPDEIREAPPPPPPAVELPPPPPPAPPPAPTVEGSFKVDFNKMLAESRASRSAGAFEAPPPSPSDDSGIVWTAEQQRALDEIGAWIRGESGAGSIFALTGAAGTGKSTLVREIVKRHCFTDAWDYAAGKFTVALTAMTGRAALRLADCAGKSATTFHKVFYWPPKSGEDVRFTRLRDPEAQLVIVDEASLMTPNVFGDLDKWVRKGVRFLLVGDAYQLPPVVTGEERDRWGEDYSVFAQVPVTSLTTVMRSAGGVLRAAARVREQGEVCRESDFDAATGAGYEYVRVDSPVKHAVDLYLADREDHLVITWRNETRMAANKLIRERLGHAGPLPDDGEPVLIKKNGQGLMNGEIVTCRGFESGPVLGSIQTMWMSYEKLDDGFSGRVLVSVNGGREGEFFDGGAAWVDNWKKYHIDLKKANLEEPIPVTFGYVITAHAAQGSEARRATVFLGRGEERSPHFRKMTTLPSGEKVTQAARWAYTSMTRSKMRTTFAVGR